MDFSALSDQLFSMLWYLIPIFTIVTVFRSARFKGWIGEFIVNLLAEFKLNQNVYHLLKNVTLPTEDGTTQIDLIIVSVYGVFVVETKNLRGWIFGSPHQKMWTQQIYKHKTIFQNPLHQNHKHVKTLQTLLKLSDEQIHSVVVFIGNGEFKTPQPDNVTFGMDYIRYIKCKTDLLIEPEEQIKIITAIENGRLTDSLKTNRKHIQHVKRLIANKEEQNFCPKCGKKMTLRKIKTGASKGLQFWGCSSFPRCRTLVPIHE